MAVPKKKMSRSRTRRRKATWKVPAPAISTCARCGSAHVAHRVCPTCGTYNGRSIVPTA